jgi:CHAT domain-containing protein
VIRGPSIYAAALSRAEALRQAQLAMLRGEWAAEGYDYAHPFYWAAFVPIGDEGPLRRTPTDA